MADSWEDWETEEPVVPGIPAAPQAEASKSKFVGEDEGEEEDPKWKANVPAPQQAKDKKGVSKYDESKGAQQRGGDDTPLDDPIAEKLRQQRLIEEADYQATIELFGKGRDLEDFIPKSAKDFEEFGKLVAGKHMLPHAKAGHYKAAVKSLLKVALQMMSAQEVKDVETCVAGIRAEKLKEEKAAQGGKKTTKKATLNVGRSGGAAGLDDYVFDDAGDGDDFDFM
ncbi:hypothetical protein CHLNCDRAFT_144733 [Chlorella variabilis]|uniref:Uncharacterized protein n=1 Tax=Chlorella variabilis TaxID=554065 RepID=E1ZCW6_CHLVA|nr:hypothetical protein CHLNCDRAFT_144733 [Chlorella variabilis]EFN56118.1 hypothetical protein CHLNCDRAFT_144733 [Chlorella variabilis]|eukprot:XP_005848220.1 hypothetical protein CHLNCDRAFT_144733 [Chlorella variabilis]